MRLPEIRIAARPSPGVDADVLAGALARCARAVGLPDEAMSIEPLDSETLGRSVSDVLVSISTEQDPLSDEYASTAWQFAHCLQDTGLFVAVEADVPVDAFEDTTVGVGAFGSHDCQPASIPPGWALNTLRFQEADELLTEDVRGGVGIRVGHPDSGWTDHPALGDAIDTSLGWDIVDDDPDATDPMNYENALPARGHGTATASVIAGRGTGDGFHGMAPRATVVPFRAIESVVQFFDTDVAKAVRRARAAGCHIVSMSLGGTGFFGLRDAIDDAVAAGMIVMAAAGNKVRVVTAPAYYDNCIAVAAVMPGDEPWPGSSRGRAVDVAAPGGCVHVARTVLNPHGPAGQIVGTSHGTSFAVAHLAGAAALWLARWGHDALCQTYGAGNIQRLFLHQLREHGCHRPDDWQDKYGTGRLDAFALISAPLPDHGDIVGVGAFGAGDSPVARLAALADVPEQQMAESLAQLLGPDYAQSLPRYEGELAFLMLKDEGFLDRMTGRAGTGAFESGPPAAASPELSTQLV